MYILLGKSELLVHSIYNIISQSLILYLICNTEIFTGKKYEDKIVSADSQQRRKKWRYIDRNCDDIIMFGILLNIIITLLNIVWSYTFESMLIFEPIYLIINIIIPLLIIWVKYHREFYKYRIFFLYILSIFIPMILPLIYVSHNTLINYPLIIVIITQILHGIETIKSAMEPGNKVTKFFSITHIATIILYLIYFDINKFKDLWSWISITSIILLLGLFYFDEEIINESNKIFFNIKNEINMMKSGVGAKQIRSNKYIKGDEEDEIKYTHIVWVVKVLIGVAMYYQSR